VLKDYADQQGVGMSQLAREWVLSLTQKDDDE